MPARKPFSATALAERLVRSEKGPFRKFSEEEVYKVVLGLQAKARHLLQPLSSGRALLEDEQDLVQHTLAQLLRYKPSDVPDRNRLAGLGQTILLNRFASLARRRVALILELPTHGEEADGGADDGEDNWLDNVASAAGKRTGDFDVSASQRSAIEGLTARQKLKELFEKVQQGNADFGEEFLDFLESLLTPRGLTAVYARKQAYTIDRKELKKVRKEQGRKTISPRQLERYIDYLLEKAHRLIEDADHSRSAGASLRRIAKIATPNRSNVPTNWQSALGEKKAKH